MFPDQRHRIIIWRRLIRMRTNVSENILKCFVILYIDLFHNIYTPLKAKQNETVSSPHSGLSCCDLAMKRIMDYVDL